MNQLWAILAFVLVGVIIEGRVSEIRRRRAHRRSHARLMRELEQHR